ncbi:MAG TPA: glycosyltransferase family 2 protein [Nitrospiraceae bacterium]|nr:glycosyltransferase family 2 protein [Nitrospiraceae bacterium]
MNISIIIPSLNAAGLLPPLFASLHNQNLSASEIIIIDSSSDDDTVEIAKSLGARVISIERKEFNHGRTRNLAASLAKGEVLVFLTQDALPYDKYFLEALISPLAQTDVIASYGRHMPKKDAIPPERFARLFNYTGQALIKGRDDIPRLGIKTFMFTNVCSALKRKEFEHVGMFPENVIMDEDLVFAATAITKGYKIAYCPKAKVMHSHNYRLVQQFKRYFDIGVVLNQQRWIRNLSAAEGQGLKYLQEEVRYLFRNGEWSWIPYAVVQSSLKFAGYRLGLMQAMLPLKVKRRLSLHSSYWDRKS